MLNQIHSSSCHPVWVWVHLQLEFGVKAFSASCARQHPSRRYKSALSSYSNEDACAVAQQRNNKAAQQCLRCYYSSSSCVFLLLRIPLRKWAATWHPFTNTKEQEQGSLYVGGDEVWIQLATSAGIGSDARGLGGTGPLLSTLQAVLT